MLMPVITVSILLRVITVELLFPIRWHSHQQSEQQQHGLSCGQFRLQQLQHDLLPETENPSCEMKKFKSKALKPHKKDTLSTKQNNTRFAAESFTHNSLYFLFFPFKFAFRF